MEWRSLLVSKRSERVLFLCSKWGVGFGASKVVEEQAKGLRSRGYHVEIGCSEFDSQNMGMFPVHRIPGRLWGLKCFLERGGWDIAIAHTFPFMGLLPEVQGVRRVVVDLGEPTPSLMAEEEREWREDLARVKALRVAPGVDAVVAISESVKRELGWPGTHVHYIGVDHFRPIQSMQDLAPKGKLRLLCIARMGKGEARYKGFPDLVRLQRDLGMEWEVVLAGRGSEEDAKPWREGGLRVENSLSDSELSELVQGCDALVSFSQWEGFNLPLAEWSHAGKPAYALALCAHPEVTPYVYDTYEELRDAISQKSRADFAQDGRMAKEFCRKFTWEANVDALDSLLRSLERPLRMPQNQALVQGIRGFWKAYAVVQRFVRWTRSIRR